MDSTISVEVKYEPERNPEDLSELAEWWTPDAVVELSNPVTIIPGSVASVPLEESGGVHFTVYPKTPD